MIGVPMANPRDSITEELNRQLENFFGAGNKAQQIASGVTGEADGPIKSTRSIKLRAARDKDAPRLQELADSGMTVIEAAKKMGTETRRARLIAQENDIRFAEQP